MSTDPSDLTTVADLAAWLGLSSPSEDTQAQLQRLVTAASNWIQQVINRTVRSLAYTETRDGHGGDRMILANGPVSSVSSVTVDGAAIPKATSTTAGYVATDSFVGLRGYRFTRGIQNVEIVYTAGFAAVPPRTRPGLHRTRGPALEGAGSNRPRLQVDRWGDRHFHGQGHARQCADGPQRVPEGGAAVIGGQVIGSEAVVSHLHLSGDVVRKKVKARVSSLTLTLLRKVKQDKLSGQILRNVTGTLRRSINQKVEESGAIITGTVGTNVVYARPHEFGVDKYKLVTVREYVRKALDAATSQWRLKHKMFVPTVLVHSFTRNQHIKLPERSFLRSAINEMRPEIRSELVEALRGGL